jgi:hypothetical protein
MRQNLPQPLLFAFVSLQFLGIGHEIGDAHDQRDDGEEEEIAVAIGEQYEEDGQEDREGRAKLGPRPGVAVDLRSLVQTSLQSKPGEDHGLVCARSEGLCNAKEGHRDEELPIDFTESEQTEGGDIAQKGPNHAPAASEKVCDSAARDFGDADEDLPETDEKANLGKG